MKSRLTAALLSVLFLVPFPPVAGASGSGTLETVVSPVVQTLESVTAPVAETLETVVAPLVETVETVATPLELPIVNGALLPTLPDLNVDATVERVADLAVGLVSEGPFFENGNTRWEYELNGDIGLLELLQLDLGVCTKIDAWSLDKTLKTVTNVNQLLAWLQDPLSDMPVTLSVIYEGILGVGQQMAELVTLDGEVFLLTTKGPECASNPATAGRITVRVLDDSEELAVRPAPISGAEVTMNGVTRMTDANGEVRFERLAYGTYTADVLAKNPRNANDAARRGSGSGTISAAHPEETIQVLLSWTSAPPTGSAGLTGRICAPPMPGATITAIGPDGRKVSTHVASDGTLGFWRYYSITNLKPVNEGAEELWTLRIEVPGKAPTETQVKVRAGQTTEVGDLTLACTGDGIPLQHPPGPDRPWVPVVASVATLVGGAFTAWGRRRRYRSRV